MKLFMWTNIVTDRSSSSMVIAIGESLSHIFSAWEKRANGSQQGFEQVRTLVNLDRDRLDKGERRYTVNRKYWGEHPSLKVYELSKGEDPVSYWIAGIDRREI